MDMTSWGKDSTWTWPSRKANYLTSAEDVSQFPEKGDAIAAVWKDTGHESALRIATLTGVERVAAVPAEEAAGTTHIGDILVLALALGHSLDLDHQEDTAIPVPDPRHQDAADLVRRGATDLLRREENFLDPLAAPPVALHAIVPHPPRREMPPHPRVLPIRAGSPAAKTHPQPTLPTPINLPPTLVVLRL